MKIKLKHTVRIISIVIAVSIFFNAQCVFAAPNNSNVDIFLLQSGVPQSVLQEMPDMQKQLIFETLSDKNVEFAGYDRQDFNISNSGELSGTNSSVVPYGGVISTSDLTLSVIGFNEEASLSDGTRYIRYSVYPSFVWNKYIKVKNDSFSMAMYPGWEVIPSMRNLRLHHMNQQGVSTAYYDLSPTGAASNGYTYKVPTSIGALQGLYEGHAYFYMDKTSQTASPRISLHYAHDYSSSMNVSYSINIGVYGSISISGNVEKINQMADNFEVVGLLS